MAILTTSGTYSFSQSWAQIITRALRQISAIQEGETPTAAIMNDCLTAAAGLVKGWMATGIHVWAEAECILFMQPNQIQYQLGAGSPDQACLFTDFTQTSLTVTAAGAASSVTVASIANLNAGDQFGVQLDAGTNFWTTIATQPSGNTVPLTVPLPSQATSGAFCFDYGTPLMRPLRVPYNGGRRYLYSSKIETPLLGISRTDYDYLPNKYNTGTVTQFFFDPQTGQHAYTNPIAFMNVWPAPSDYTNALRFIGQRPLQDVGGLANLPDFPVEWTNAITWNLALEMAAEFDVPQAKIDVVAKRAGYWFGVASQWDKEMEPILFGYATEPGYR
jgi:hypothetical protein